MNVLINLLPDIRQAKLRERRRRQLVSGVSIMVWAICGGIVVLLTVYATGQKVLIAGLSDSITKKQDELRKIDKLPEALTAADHLASLPGLYDQRVSFKKFFERFQAIDPTNVTLDTVTVDAQNVMTINGVGANYAAVTKLVRAMEAANVTIGEGAKTSNQPYFKDVNLVNAAAEGTGLVYSITATLDPGVTSGN